LDTTKALSKYIKDKGIAITTISEKTNLNYNTLYSSLAGSRKLRADEFLLICNFIEVDPKKFTPQVQQIN
jgi:lambda repressor-like predicted transcriptional regulator